MFLPEPPLLGQCFLASSQMSPWCLERTHHSEVGRRDGNWPGSPYKQLLMMTRSGHVTTVHKEEPPPVFTRTEAKNNYQEIPKAVVKRHGGASRLVETSNTHPEESLEGSWSIRTPSEPTTAEGSELRRLGTRPRVRRSGVNSASPFPVARRRPLNRERILRFGGKKEARHFVVLTPPSQKSFCGAGLRGTPGIQPHSSVLPAGSAWDRYPGVLSACAAGCSRSGPRPASLWCRQRRAGRGGASVRATGFSRESRWWVRLSCSRNPAGGARSGRRQTARGPAEPEVWKIQVPDGEGVQEQPTCGTRDCRSAQSLLVGGPGIWAVPAPPFGFIPPSWSLRRPALAKVSRPSLPGVLPELPVFILTARDCDECNRLPSLRTEGFPTLFS
ncbi:hypothetical protein Cadr_000004130 [Camelus dromedarius]|uniref:Uncharacterized protein n=1 Tax=Camelus dromedarius TaxID=9838 RepID=A0A5N4ECM6_CAMDR|nr:hypothetical protein Cadr_000004130 [Camelus dromedarius]